MSVPYYSAPLVGAANTMDRRISHGAAYWKRMQQLSVFSEPNHVTSVAVSPKHPHHIACTSSVRLTLYDSQWCQQVNQFSRFKRAVFGVTFRNDGELLALGGEEGKLRVFDAVDATGRKKTPLRSIKVGECFLHSVQFSASGKAVYSFADDGFIKRFDIADTNTEPVTQFRAHSDAIRCGVASSSNENIVVSGSYDHHVKLWDVRANSEDLAPIVMDAGAPVESVLLLTNENLLATASGNVVKIWDLLGGGRLLTTLQAHHKTVTSLCLAENGATLLTGAIDKRINALRVADFSMIHSMSVAAPVLSLAMSPDDQTMAVGMSNLLALYRRAPEKERVVALDIAEPKSRVRVAPAAPIVQVKGEPKEKSELVAQMPDKLQLSKWDMLQKSFRHHTIIERLFTTSSIFEQYASLAVSQLQVIAHRNALHSALSGHRSTVYVNLLKFLARNLYLEPYFDTLAAVSEVLLEILSKEDLDDKVALQFNRLKDSIERELTVQKQIAQAIGAFELVLNGTKPNAKRLSSKLSEEVFGEPIISSIRLDLNSENA